MNKLIDAVKETVQWGLEMNGRWRNYVVTNPEKVVNVMLSALWTDYDADDESTWPEPVECILELQDGSIVSGCARQLGDSDFWNNPAACWISGPNVKRWMYTADLIVKEIE